MYLIGTVSSPGIYDRLAKLVLHIVIKKCDMPRRCVVQHLDDVCSVSPKGSGRAKRFYDCYGEVCDKIGVRLATVDDPDKAFGPSTDGIVLGVCYDTERWVWYLREDKISIILNMLENAMEDEEMTQRTVQSLNGKLVNIRCLIPVSKFYLANLIMDAHQTRSWCRWSG